MAKCEIFAGCSPANFLATGSNSCFVFVMAFYSWISDVGSSSLPEVFEEVLSRLDLEINLEFSKDGEVFAGDSVAAALPLTDRIGISAQWLSPRKRDCLIEVRSGELHNQYQNRCSRIAAELEKAFPPKSMP